MRDLYLTAIDTALRVSRQELAPATALSEDTADIALDLVSSLHPLPEADTRRIVIADDNRDLVESLRMALEFDGHKVYATYDGIGALRLARALKPDFLLLDIAMPNINGYDVARQIRSRDWGHDLRIVAITGRGRPEDLARESLAGFDFHLTKPVPLEVLSGILAARKVAPISGRRPELG